MAQQEIKIALCGAGNVGGALLELCLLYTSDAADE